MALLGALAMLMALPERSALAATSRERDCLAMIAYLEAASEGVQGMQAVINVVRNRMKDARFPDTACAVIGQNGQFEPMERRPQLKRVVRSGRAFSLRRVLGIDTGYERMMLGHALRLAGTALKQDLTRGALYFVNPYLMMPDRCPWFAKLRRTAKIGAHVFMTHYDKAEAKRGPALDCRSAGRDLWMVKAKAKKQRSAKKRRAKRG